MNWNSGVAQLLYTSEALSSVFSLAQHEILALSAVGAADRAFFIASDVCHGFRLSHQSSQGIKEAPRSGRWLSVSWGYACRKIRHPIALADLSVSAPT